MYNGVPEISIPLYTIHLKGMDIPINLSYHASGIKYHQSNGDVGVGWTLNPGYRIARTIYGLPDDKYEMPSNIGDMLEAREVGLPRDKFLAMFMNDLDGSVPQREDVNKNYDGEYDIFNYMLPTESGSFLIKDRQNKTIQTLEESKARITYQTGISAARADGFLNFDVVDEQGNKYGGMHWIQ